MKIWLDDAKTQERFKSMAGFPAYGTPEQFDRPSSMRRSRCGRA